MKNHTQSTDLTRQTSQIIKKSPVKFISWENMFSNFLQFFKEKQAQNPSIRSNRKTPKKVVKDPIETYTPLEQVNPFSINPKLRFGFRQYLDGKKSALQLVNECNHEKTSLTKQAKMKQQMRRIQKATLKNQTQRPYECDQQLQESKFKFLHLLGFEDESLVQKIRVQKRYDMVRKLLAKNMQLRSTNASQKNWKGVELYKNMQNICEENKRKIEQKDILSLKNDGVRDYTSLHYVRRNSGLNLKLIDKKDLGEQINKSPKQILSDIRIEQFRAKKEVNDFCEDFIQNMDAQNYVQEQKEKRRNKLNIVSSRKREKLIRSFLASSFQKDYKQFIEFDEQKQKGKKYRQFTEPFLKDIQLYSYLHDHLGDIVVNQTILIQKRMRCWRKKS